VGATNLNRMTNSIMPFYEHLVNYTAELLINQGNAFCLMDLWINIILSNASLLKGIKKNAILLNVILPL